MPTLAILAHFIASYRPPSGNLSSDSCRGGPKLRNEYSNIKIGQLFKFRNEEKVRQPQILTSRSRASIIMPMYSITHVSHCPCAPYPCTPYPLYPITHVPHTPCTPLHPVSYCLCTPYPYSLYSFASVGLITHVSHTPVPHCPLCPQCPLLMCPIPPVPHCPHSPCGPLSNGDKGDGAHGAIAYRGMWYRRYRPHGQ